MLAKKEIREFCEFCEKTSLIQNYDYHCLLWFITTTTSFTKNSTTKHKGYLGNHALPLGKGGKGKGAVEEETDRGGAAYS
ncbi:hypothetical protein HMPREF9148_02435 [Prevotella sp. F0091]|nr:hypothetical protein HMPREF9148_02435 [Prevotella sp. F0091]